MVRKVAHGVTRRKSAGKSLKCDTMGEFASQDSTLTSKGGPSRTIFDPSDELTVLPIHVRTRPDQAGGMMNKASSVAVISVVILNAVKDLSA